MLPIDVLVITFIEKGIAPTYENNRIKYMFKNFHLNSTSKRKLCNL